MTNKDFIGNWRILDSFIDSEFEIWGEFWEIYTPFFSVITIGVWEVDEK